MPDEVQECFGIGRAQTNQDPDQGEPGAHRADIYKTAFQEGCSAQVDLNLAFTVCLTVTGVPSLMRGRGWIGSIAQENLRSEVFPDIFAVIPGISFVDLTRVLLL